MQVIGLEREYLLALAHTGVTSGLLSRLIQVCGSPQSVWKASEQLIKSVARKDGAEHFMWARQAIQPGLLNDLYAKAQVDVVFQGDAQYPELLLQTEDPPIALFIRGRLDALQLKTLGVVGTRRITAYGQRVTETLMEELKPWHPCIVSGLAAGVDTAAHEGALRHGLPTVAVLGTGPDVVYPRQNEKLVKAIVEAGGAVITENPLNAPGSRHAFPRRNRIIAGVSQGVLVVEGNQKSGALITARYALEENRQVMAIPGSVFAPTSLGPNQLIQQGAALVQSAEDIATTLNWLPFQMSLLGDVSEAPPNSPDLESMLSVLSPLEREVLNALPYEPMVFDTLCGAMAHVPTSQLNAALAILQLHGLATSLAGGRYCRN